MTGTPFDAAFARVRAELGIRTAFPAEVLAAAEHVARTRVPSAGDGRADRTEVPFVTIDPPGSRDLDQAVWAARDGEGYRLCYAIADVGFWVDRGSAIEREAFQRGVTFYLPDRRESLYPPALSEGAASLLPGQPRPAVLFTFALAPDATLRSWEVERALVRSTAQLTYGDLQQQAAGTRAADAPGAAVLLLVAEIGATLLALEAARGGVSLPVRTQHVERRAATRLGFELVYEEPNEAESWNSEVSLLTGHVAAERMLEAKVGMLRTMPPFVDAEVARFRRIARTLGFAWPEGQTYPEFMHAVDPRHAHIDVLVRQARRVMHGAEYVAFSGTLPEQTTHGALAMTYAHCTAPLRRLGDRYVLDLLVALGEGKPLAGDTGALLEEVAQVMNAASRVEGKLERRIVDLAEAVELARCVGRELRGVVTDIDRGRAEVQVEEPPVRAVLAEANGHRLTLGEEVRLTVAGVDASAGTVQLALAR